MKLVWCCNHESAKISCCSDTWIIWIRANEYEIWSVLHWSGFELTWLTSPEWQESTEGRKFNNNPTNTTSDDVSIIHKRERFRKLRGSRSCTRVYVHTSQQVGNCTQTWTEHTNHFHFRLQMGIGPGASKSWVMQTPLNSQFNSGTNSDYWCKL